jgi:hypothetical protein
MNTRIYRFMEPAQLMALTKNKLQLITSNTAKILGIDAQCGT